MLTDFAKFIQSATPPSSQIDKRLMAAIIAADLSDHAIPEGYVHIPPYHLWDAGLLSRFTPGGVGRVPYPLVQRFIEHGLDLYFVTAKLRSEDEQGKLRDMVATMLAYDPQSVVDGQLLDITPNRLAESQAAEFVRRLKVELLHHRFPDVLVLSSNSRGLGSTPLTKRENIELVKKHYNDTLNLLSKDAIASWDPSGAKEQSPDKSSLNDVFQFLARAAEDGEDPFLSVSISQEQQFVQAFINIKWGSDFVFSRRALGTYNIYRATVATNMAKNSISMFGALEFNRNSGNKDSHMPSLNLPAVSM
jgi:hypothetical protein